MPAAWESAPIEGAQPTKQPAWMSAPVEKAKPGAIAQMVGNIPGSAAKFAGGIADMVMHPVDTASGAFDMAAGGLRNLAPEGLRMLIDKADATPETAAAQARAGNTADAVGQYYSERLRNPGKTVQEDPVGALADVSMLLTGGAGALRGAGLAAKAANATRGAAPAIDVAARGLDVASKATNPLSIIGPAVQGAGVMGKNMLGLTTGVGAENIAQAAKSGFKGGGDDFAGHITGRAAQTDVLDAAKAALDKMASDKAASYRQNMAAVSGDKSVLDFGGIDKAIADARGVVTYKGQVTNARAGDAVGKMEDAVQEWKALEPKEFHTPEGLDALKKRLGGILESIPFEEKTARLAAGKVYNAVKSEITQQAPTYANAMSDYAALSDEISQIERALSLGKRASVDTAMRKLQSLARNNANTNYGERLSMAKTLEEKGGVDLMPAIAGQALNSWTPRGLAGQAGGIGSGIAAFSNPATLAMLPAMSPRLVGGATYGGGLAAGEVARRLGALGINPDRVKLGSLIGGRLGQSLQDQPDW